MNVRELQVALKRMPPDMPVGILFEIGRGDYVVSPLQKAEKHWVCFDAGEDWGTDATPEEITEYGLEKALLLVEEP